MIISIIVAAARNGVIGKNNQLIWHLPADLKRFKSITTGHTIILGRKTFESIGKPLPNRQTIIISRNLDYFVEGCKTASSLVDAIKLAENQEEIFICGGGEIYKQAIEIADRIYFTRVEADFEGDTVFPEIDNRIWKIMEEIEFQVDDKNKIPYTFLTFAKKQHEL